MSDFLYSSARSDSERLAESIRQIYHNDQPQMFQFDGSWGSLAVSRSLYTGFDPVETTSHVLAVAGGPLLKFQTNDFLTGTDNGAGSRALLDRWLNGGINWEEDLSGPFAIIIIHKHTNTITTITDLMMFTPVYIGQATNGFAIGSHVDAVARACGQVQDYDQVSLVDFILHDVVTYPYTAYEHVMQAHPGALQDFHVHGEGVVALEPSVYWLPEEGKKFSHLEEAAIALRTAVTDYVEVLTSSMSQVAHFLSAGEDSRALAGILPATLQRDAYIFVDTYNREGRIAARAAGLYGSRFHLRTRDTDHYLQIMGEASKLSGLGHQYTHAHTLGFHKTCGLQNYSAVFGGYAADALLKGLETRKTGLYSRLPFMPKFALTGETRSQEVTSSLFDQATLDEITHRRREHVDRVRAFRPTTVHEWFALWPMTMRRAVGNLYTNRRLFPSYEPFTASDVVKVSASVPTSWKLNRRLFHAAFRPTLRSTWRTPTGDGRYPYFPWWMNAPIQAILWTSRTALRYSRLGETNSGAWADWWSLQRSAQWAAIARSANGQHSQLPLLNQSESLLELLQHPSLTISQRTNLLQVASQIGASRSKASIDS